MEEEEIPPWDWRRTAMLEAELSNERAKNAELQERIRVLEGRQSKLDSDLKEVRSALPKPMLPMVVVNAE